MRCSGHVSLGGDPGEDPGHVGETGLGTPRGPPGKAGGSGRGQGRLGFSAQAAATRPKQQMMNGWILLDYDCITMN